MGKTEELSKDTRDKIVDQLLAQLLENGRIQDDCQSPSDWGSVHDLASWSINDPEKGEG